MGRNESPARRLGEALTGGKQTTGYLAVGSGARWRHATDADLPPLGILEATPVQSSAHKDADIGHPVRTARTTCLVAGS